MGLDVKDGRWLGRVIGGKVEAALRYAGRSVTEEAIVEAKVAIEAVEGNNGNRVCALPHDRLMEIPPVVGDPGR